MQREFSLALHPEHGHAVIALARRACPEFRALLAVSSASAVFTSICNTRPIVSRNATPAHLDHHHTLLPPKTNGLIWYCDASVLAKRDLGVVGKHDLQVRPCTVSLAEGLRNTPPVRIYWKNWNCSWRDMNCK